MKRIAVAFKLIKVEPAKFYFLKVNKRKNRKRCELRLKLTTIKTQEQR